MDSDAQLTGDIDVQNGGHGVANLLSFLPRCCMQCRRGVSMRILSLRLSVCQTRDL